MKMMQGACVSAWREQIAHAGGADADEHFDEIGAAEAEKRHLRFPGDGLGQQRFSGPRRPDQQDALGDSAAEGLVLLRRLRKSTTSRSSATASSMPGDVFEM